jgi:hypothetical protein
LILIPFYLQQTEIKEVNTNSCCFQCDSVAEIITLLMFPLAPMILPLCGDISDLQRDLKTLSPFKPTKFCSENPKGRDHSDKRINYNGE